MRYPKRASLILKACRLSFYGERNRDIADELNVAPSEVSRWRKLDLWIEFEKELLDAEKKALLNTQLESGAKAENLAQG